MPALTHSGLVRSLDLLRGPMHSARKAGAFIDLWAVAGLARKEVRTAAVLAWLLDPQGSHGQDDLFLQRLWKEVSAASECRLGFELEAPQRSRTEINPMGDLNNRVDIELEGRDFLVFIEVKIDAGLRQDQLQNYIELA
jgi:hypothetical protein